MTTTTQDRISQIISGTTGVTGTSSSADQSGSINRNSLYYPVSTANENENWIILEIMNYSRSQAASIANINPTGKSIILPLPNSLSESTSMNWNTTELGAFGNFLANEHGDQISNMVKDGVAAQQLGVITKDNLALQSDVQQNFMDRAYDYTKGAAGAIASDALGSTRLASQLGMFGGVARNPFTAMLFEGPDLRTFRFDYMFAPKSLKDADAIRNIRKTLLYHIHPGFETKFANYLFSYPSLFKVNISNDEYLFKYKTCIMRNLHVDFQPMGRPIYIDSNGKKIPAAVRFSFELCETTVRTREDIK